MKKLAILFTLFIAMHITISCSEETINVDPIGYTEAGFFLSEQDYDWAVKGIYHKIGNYYAFQGDPMRVVQAIWLLPSDDMTTRGNQFGEEMFSALNGTNDRLSRFYTISYQAIQRANVVIEKLAENGDVVFTLNPQLKDVYRGEALFLRGYAHFMLWNVFGTAPVVTKRFLDIPEASKVTNSTGTQLLDQAIADLTEAATLLPDSWTGNNIGRLTKNSAWGMNAKALVFRATVTGSNADYLSAIAEVDKIGTNGAQPRSLITAGVDRAGTWVPAYARLFDAYDDNNSESLFEFQANRSQGQANTFVPGLDDWSDIGEMAHYVGYANIQPSWVNERFYTGTENLYQAYGSSDPRRDLNFTTANFTGQVRNINKYTRNFIAAPAIGGAMGLAVNNPKILRLADVLLLKAEAIVMSGGSLNDAIAIINQIRARARNSVAQGAPAADEPADRATGVDKATVLSWIWEERRLELAFEEGHRWFDLRRRHLATTPDIKVDLKSWNWYSNLQGVEFKDFNINFPLPNTEVQQTELNQNTGY